MIIPDSQLVCCHTPCMITVSYTHLDVYKRQRLDIQNYWLAPEQYQSTTIFACLGSASMKNHLLGLQYEDLYSEILGDLTQ